MSTSYYITINDTAYYPNVEGSTLSAFDLKMNRCGGDYGTVSFSKQNVPVNIMDKVQLYINDTLKYTGYIEAIKLTTSGLVIDIIPEWGLLTNIIITGTAYQPVDDEQTFTPYFIVNDILEFVEKAGFTIGEVAESMDQSEYAFTTTTAGKTVAEMLDECLEVLPVTYNWSVIDGVFNFVVIDYSIDYTANNILNWRDNDFEQSAVDEDWGDLYTQTAVYVTKTLTDGDGNETEYLKYIDTVPDGVGDRLPLGALSQLGYKMNKYEFSFDVGDEQALNFAYNLLAKQSPTVITTVTNLNYGRKLPNILDYYSVRTQPETELTVPVAIDVASKVTYKGGRGAISKIGSKVNTADFVVTVSSNIVANVDFTKYVNNSGRLVNVLIYYSTDSSNIVFTVSDGTTTIEAVGDGDKANINLEGVDFDKRSLYLDVVDAPADLELLKVYLTFENAATTAAGVIRTLHYKMNSYFQLSIDLELADINATLTGYLFAQNKSIERLEALISGSY